MGDYPENLLWLFGRHRFGMTRTLDTTRKLLAFFGDPHEKIPAIHVAGTNGKGSSCAMLASISQAAGYRTGLYTSPHLVDWRERIRIDGELVPEEAIAPLLESIRPLANDLQATFFEVTTAIAFQAFREMKCELNIIETGLGGTWDCTNVLHPVVAHITRIDLDHTEILGKTRLIIARDKTGIWKSGTFATASRQTAPVEKFLRTRWVERNATSLRLARDTVRVLAKKSANFNPITRLGQTVSLHPISEEAKTEFSEIKNLTLALYGKHQRENLEGVLCVVLAAREAGLRFENQSVIQGLQQVAWSSRLQILAQKPITISDVAHNPAGAKALVETLLESFQPAPPSRFRVVLSLLADKDLDGYLSELMPLDPIVYATTLHETRGRSGDEIVCHCRKIGIESLAFDDPKAALNAAIQDSHPNDVLTLTGSHYLVGALLPEFQK